MAQKISSHWLEQAFHALTRLPSRLMLTLEDWRERSSLAHEFDALAAHGELDRTLIEAGLSPSDVPRLLKGHPGAARQLPAMMRRVGIDSSQLPSTAALREIEWRCTECRSWRRCRAWLAAGGGGQGYRVFCPNAAELEQIRDRSAVARCGQSGVLHELEAMRGQIL